MPVLGEIVHAFESWEEPAGGGPDAAAQLAKLTDETIFFTALGDDELGHRAARELTALGVRVEAVFRPEPTRRAIVHIDDAGERTITVVGERLGPRADDPLPWDELEKVKTVYFTAGDLGALQHARRARVLVATARAMDVLKGSGVELDGLVASALDPAEVYREGDLDPPPKLVVLTGASKGGTYQLRGSEPMEFEAAPVPGAIVNRYGTGDAFAACLAYALGRDQSPADAVAIASRCGAAVLTGRAPYEGQLTREDLDYRS
jgi:ribokinase